MKVEELMEQLGIFKSEVPIKVQIVNPGSKAGTSIVEIVEVKSKSFAVILVTKGKS